MSDQYIILGEFKGLLFTKQEVIMGMSEDKPKDESHAIRAYEGQLVNPVFLKEYTPEDYRTHESFLLANASNITVVPGPDAPFSAPKSFDFNQVILIDPKVEKSWQLNGKTYYRINSRFLGITHKPADLLEPDPPPLPQPVPPPYPDPWGDEDHGTDYGSTDGDGDDGGGGVVPTPWNDGCNPMGCGWNGGCFGGCLDFLLKLLALLAIVLCLFGLLSFLGIIGPHTDYCEKADQKREEILRQQRTNDSLRLVSEKNARDRFGFFSSIYFFRDQVVVRDVSINNFVELVGFLKTNESLKIEIQGHSNGAAYERPGIDLERAKAIYRKFVELGIAPERMTTKGYSDQKRKSGYEMQRNQTGEFNQNMRVDIKLLN
jgi:outer membrane protein OmpA-like peptidoglycan-associated protein